MTLYNEVQNFEFLNKIYFLKIYTNVTVISVRTIWGDLKHVVIKLDKPIKSVICIIELQV